MKSKRSIGFWMLISIGILLNIIYLLGQTMAFINYDFTVSVGLQEPLSDITAIGVASNKGFGLGDTFIYIPLFLIGIFGMLKRSEIGLFAMFGAMAVTMYWPVVALSTLFFAKGAPGFNFTDFTSYTITLSLIFLFGLWGAMYIVRHRKELI